MCFFSLQDSWTKNTIVWNSRKINGASKSEGNPSVEQPRLVGWLSMTETVYVGTVSDKPMLQDFVVEARKINPPVLT